MLSTKDVILEAREVNNALMDEESRVIFRNKLLYEISAGSEMNILVR